MLLRLRRSRTFTKLIRNRVGVIGFVILTAFLSVAALAPLIAPADPNQGNIRARLQPPSRSAILGTDHQGRDVLSRVIWGSRIALLVGTVSVLIGLGIGGVAGLISGYFGGFVDTVIMRFVDFLLSFPYLLLVIAVVTILGFNIVNAMIAIGVSLVPQFARVVRSVAVSIREEEYVTAAHAIGCRNVRILLIHVLPNCVPSLVVLTSISLAKAILAEAGLSFLGLGVQPPDPSWGTMISIGREFLMTHPYLSIAPGVAIMGVVLSLNLLGDALQDALNPTAL